MSANNGNKESNKSPAKLLNLCADVVVKYTSITKMAIDGLPHELFPALLDASLRELRVLPLSMLISNWPLTHLIYNRYNAYPKVQHLPLVYGILTHAIAANIQDYLRENSKLKLIDLRSIPIDSYGMLAFARAILDIDQYQYPSHHHRHHLTFSFDHTVNCGSKRKQSTSTKLSNRVSGMPSKKLKCGHHRLQLYIQCHVDQHNYHEVCQLLQLENSRVNVHIVSLRCQEMGCKKVLTLLRLLKCHEITDLNLDFNDLSGKYFQSLTQQLQQCSRLTTLNLAYNNFNRMEIALLSDTLLHLKTLRHVNLSGNRLTSILHQIIANLTPCITTLILNYCCLANDDISALAHSQLCQHLNQLHLESNNLSQKLNPLKHLLSCTNNLTIIKLHDNGIDQTAYLSLCQAAPAIEHVLAKWNEQDMEQ